MRITTASAVLLLHLAAAPCEAESMPRTSLDVLNFLSRIASPTASASDPSLPIPPRVPTEVDLGDGGSSLRITDYYSPFVSSYNLLPCMVDMLTTAFNGVAGETGALGSQKLEHNQFVCQRNGLELRFVGNQITPPLEYSDLVRLASLVLRFQQKYTLPGVSFSYLNGRRIRGQGHVYMLFVGNQTVSVAGEE